MEENLKHASLKKLEAVKAKLENNRFDVVLLDHKEEVIPYLETVIQNHASIGVGGSVTLDECGIIEWLRTYEGCIFIDRYKMTDRRKAFRDSLCADAFITSSNAITMDGMLYNVDGNGNRVAALTYGPDKVYVIAGVNKIVKDIEAAKIRVETIAAPANCVRLNKDTPCTKVGSCMHCNSDSTICSSYVITRRCAQRGRITVVLVNEELGY